MNIKKFPLAENQYYKQAFSKTSIFLHHTAGGSAASSIAYWASNPEHIATPYLIDRDGIIYECYDPNYWAYSLGVKGNSQIERSAIPIEICSYGNLVLKDGRFLNWTGKEVKPDKVIKCSFRGFDYYEKYTDEQIKALYELLPFLVSKFNLKLQSDKTNFFEFQNPNKLLPGIWSHSTVRKDKVDIFPQKELVELVYNL